MYGNSGLGKGAAFILGFFIFSGAIGLGFFVERTALKVKNYERTVRVKGLAEKEFLADIVIWPIRFQVTNNSLRNLYLDLEKKGRTVSQFLEKEGIKNEDISFSPPSVEDRQSYSNYRGARYSGSQTVSVYSKSLKEVHQAMNKMIELGKEGVVLEGNNYGSRVEYLFTRLNEVKPEMIEEATKKAREVAEKFAKDSQSSLGKIKRASQGQFSIQERDKNNPHIKKLRVVSTIEYYLAD